MPSCFPIDKPSLPMWSHSYVEMLPPILGINKALIRTATQQQKAKKCIDKSSFNFFYTLKDPEISLIDLRLRWCIGGLCYCEIDFVVS